MSDTGNFAAKWLRKMPNVQEKLNTNQTLTGSQDNVPYGVTSDNRSRIAGKSSNDLKLLSFLWPHHVRENSAE